MRLVLLGGGGFRVPLVHRALLARQECGVDELVLFDVDGDRARVIAGLLDPSPGVRVRVADDARSALTGADVVFSAIRVGGAAGRVRDERRALALGLLGQETVGAGGLAYALRTLPVVTALARLQAEVAPRAWLINFTNPAGLLTQALVPVLGHRVVGICDSPVGLIRRAARAVGADADQVRADYIGINHLGWLNALVRDGVDLLPGLLSDDTRLAGFEEGRLFDPGLLRALGALPNEYLQFFYAARELTAALQHAPTRGEVVAAEQDEFLRIARSAPGRAGAAWERTRRRREETYLAEARDRDRDEADLAGGGYETVALDLMAALCGGPAVELIADAPNAGARPQLPAGMVVETWCRVDAAGARPRPGPELPLHQLGLIASVRAAEDAVIEAVARGRRDLAVHAFAVHPLIGSRPLAEALVASVERDEPTVAGLWGR